MELIPIFQSRLYMFNNIRVDVDIILDSGVFVGKINAWHPNSAISATARIATHVFQVEVVDADTLEHKIEAAVKRVMDSKQVKEWI